MEINLDKKRFIYAKNEEVIVHSLGDGKEYKARVVGIHRELKESVVYIIEMLENFRYDEKYDFVTISGYYLKK